MYFTTKPTITTMNFSPIKQWSEDERPREKMLQKGSAALTDAELLAILIQNGTKQKSALDLAREILQLVNNDLEKLGRLSIKELQQVKGIGQAKAITLMAAMELGRRRQLTQSPEKIVINNSKAAAQIFNPLLRDLNHEALAIIYLNNAGKILHQEILSFGGITNTIVDIKLILKNALLHLASNIIVAHNHPSGTLNPSNADIDITQKLKEAAKAVDIKLYDHIIIAGNDFYSFNENGMM